MINHGNKWFMVAWLSAVCHSVHIEEHTDIFKFIILIKWRYSLC